MRYERSRPRWQGVVPEPVVSGETVLVSVDGGVATVTLNRPEQRNALDNRVLRELTAALLSCDAAEDVRAIVLTGAGSTFCVGSELSDGAFGGSAAEGPITTDDWVAPFHLRTPVIAALNGHTVGAGLTLALQCDLRLVAEDAKLGLPFVKLGVVTEWAGHWTAVHLLGIARAAELLLTGELIDGRRAAEWGLASRALPAADVLPEALALAHRLATTTSAVSVAVSKRLMWEAAAESQPSSSRREHELLDALLAGPDAAEGPSAFLAKRPAVWSGRLAADLPDWPDPDRSENR